MKSTRFVAIMLLIAGALGLAYGGFSYTKETHRADLGSMHLSVDERSEVNIPAWAGVGMLLVGLILLVPRQQS